MSCLLARALNFTDQSLWVTKHQQQLGEPTEWSNQAVLGARLTHAPLPTCSVFFTRFLQLFLVVEVGVGVGVLCGADTLGWDCVRTQAPFRFLHLKFETWLKTRCLASRLFPTWGRWWATYLLEELFKSETIQPLWNGLFYLYRYVLEINIVS